MGWTVSKVGEIERVDIRDFARSIEEMIQIIESLPMGVLMADEDLFTAVTRLTEDASTALKAINHVYGKAVNEEEGGQ